MEDHVVEVPRAPNVRKAEAPKSWRDVIEVHPAANLFPMMSPDELKALGADIKKNGMVVPVVFWADKDGREFLLDGRNRLDAMERIGLPVVDTEGRLHVPLRCRAAVDPYEYVLSANLHRRHLTPEQKRELIAKVIKAKPGQPNSAIARQLKGFSTDKTIASVRRELEARSEIPNVSTVEDTKGRKQPARKKRRSVDDFIADKKAQEKAACGEVADFILAKAKAKARAKIVTDRAEPPPPVSEEVSQQRTAAAVRIRALMGSKTPDDSGPDSEVERLRTRVEQFENRTKGLQADIAEKDRLIRELRAENRRLDHTADFLLSEREAEPDAPDITENAAQTVKVIMNIDTDQPGYAEAVMHGLKARLTPTDPLDIPDFLRRETAGNGLRS